MADHPAGLSGQKRVAITAMLPGAAITEPIGEN
jgi:hypothetical protein